MSRLNIDTPVLTTNQRHIYNHFLYHQKHHKHSPCFVPKATREANFRVAYLKALDKLEEMGLVSIDRSAENYTSWILLPPKKSKSN